MYVNKTSFQRQPQCQLGLTNSERRINLPQMTTFWMRSDERYFFKADCIGFQLTNSSKVLDDACAGYVKAGSEIIAGYLMKDNDPGFIDYVFSPFNNAPPPDAAGTRHPGLFSAGAAISHLVILLAAFDLSPSDLDSHKSIASRALLDRWTNIVLWLRLLFQSLTSQDRAGLFGNCIQFLKKAIYCFWDDRNLEEVFSLPCTADLVFVLVCRVEPYPWHESAIQVTRDILAVLLHCVDERAPLGQITRFAFVSQLSTAKKATRKAVILSLVCRAKEFADWGTIPRHLQRADLRNEVSEALLILSLCTVCLVDVDPSLWKDLLAQDFQYEYARALNRMADAAVSNNVKDQDFWRFMAEATTVVLRNGTWPAPSRFSAMARATEAGLVSCALTCLVQLDPKTNSDGVRQLKVILKLMSQYSVTSSRAIKAFSTTYPKDTINFIQNQRQDLLDVADFFNMILSQDVASGGTLRDVKMCDNPKVRGDRMWKLLNRVQSN
ncbi:hypothetical protein EST38_g11065 [Candolleomyces aberdarensis]|uniref:Uncharacterized protein n=1 Tax=Candolleomyces aberdarensis TaxID=2316362 RepID=A0A4Q2D6H1_9AGAR|nr:hypothetical protein EST38_g11065 [Candolleomyces aberdarensis]